MYIGRPCKKHPEYGGKRYGTTRAGNCPGCTLDHNVGKICSKHPEAGGRRIGYACVECKAEWMKKANARYYAKRRARKRSANG